MCTDAAAFRTPREYLNPFLSTTKRVSWPCHSRHREVTLEPFNFRRDIVPFLVATIGEFAALVLWLRFRDAGALAAANIALWTGFAIERIAVALWVRFVLAPGAGGVNPLWVTGAFLFVITVAEVAIWGFWLRVARASGALAGATVLFALIHVLHSVEMGAVRRHNPLRYAINARTLGFSLMEALGGAGWLLLADAGRPVLGALVLLGGLTVEHLVQGGLLKPEPVAAPARPAPA